MSTAAYKTHSSTFGFSFPDLTTEIKTPVSTGIRKFVLWTFEIVYLLRSILFPGTGKIFTAFYQYQCLVWIVCLKSTSEIISNPTPLVTPFLILDQMACASWYLLFFLNTSRLYCPPLLPHEIHRWTAKKKVQSRVACEMYWHEETPFSSWVGHMIGIWQRVIAWLSEIFSTVKLLI